MTYAIISTGGKQYKIAQGDVLSVDRLAPENDTVTFSDVLLYVGGTDIKVGSPLLSDVVVTAKVLENFKGEKVRVAKFKAKAKYRRVNGFRASLTKVQIADIVVSGQKKQENNSEKSAQASATKKTS